MADADEAAVGFLAPAGKPYEPTVVPPWQPGDPIDVADVPPGKTFTSLLQEACVRKEVTPQYDVLSTEGRAHDPQFVFRVTVGEMVATGRAKSKKAAKHLAAKGVLEQIVASGNHIDWMLPGRSPNEASEYLDTVMLESGIIPLPEPPADGAEESGEASAAVVGAAQLPNPVGKLNERCVKNKWPPPEFCIEEDTGQPHDKHFVIICRVGNQFVEKGTGRNKKVAKRMAAELMFHRLSQLPDADQDSVYERDDAAQAQSGSAYSTAMESELVEAAKTANADEKGVAAAAAKTAGDAAVGGAALGRLRQMNLDDASPSGQSVELLRDVSLEQPTIGLEPAYKHLDNRDRNVVPAKALDLQRVDAFFIALGGDVGAALGALLDGRPALRPGDVDFARVLSLIAAEQRFGVTVVRFAPRDAGLRQCVVQLQTAPVAVCYGSGETNDAAVQDAALNALRYLQVMLADENDAVQPPVKEE